MIVVTEVQLIPARVTVDERFRLRVKAHDEAQLADTSKLQRAIRIAALYSANDYSNYDTVTAAVAAGEALIASRPTSDRQAEVDAATQAILDALGALEWAQGTLENPIEYSHMMDVTAGLYYKYSKSIWKCLQSKSPCLVFPGTAPNVWEKIKNI